MPNQYNNTKLLIITEFPDSYKEIPKKYPHQGVKIFDVSNIHNDKKPEIANIILSIKQKFPEMRCENILLDLHGNVKKDNTHVFSNFGESGLLIQELQGVFKAHNFIITSCHCGKKSMSQALEKYNIYGNIIHFGSTKNLLIGSLVKDDIEAIIDFLYKTEDTKEINTNDIVDICKAIYTIHIHRLRSISTFNKYDKIKYFGNIRDKENVQENSQKGNEENNQEYCERENLLFNLLRSIFKFIINIIKFICNIFVLFTELIFNIIFDSDVEFKNKKADREISISIASNILDNKQYQYSDKLLLRFILEGKFELAKHLIGDKQDLAKNIGYQHLLYAALSNNVKMLDCVMGFFSKEERIKNLQQLFTDISVNIIYIDCVKEEMIDKMLSIKDRLGIKININDTSNIRNFNNASIQKKLQKILCNAGTNNVNKKIHFPSNHCVKCGHSISNDNSNII